MSQASLFGFNSTRTVSIANTVREYLWHIECDCTISAENDSTTIATLTSRLKSDAITSTDISPKPSHSIRDPIELFIGHNLLFNNNNNNNNNSFNIDRKKRSCHTPRRNEDVERVLLALEELSSWCDAIDSYIRTSVLLFASNESLWTQIAQDAASIFIPVAPLSVSRPNDSAVLLSSDEEQLMLREHSKALSTKIANVEKAFVVATHPLVKVNYFSIMTKF